MKVLQEEEGSVHIEIGNCEHLWIETPRGRIKVYVGRTWSSITSWVDDTDYAGFYTNKTSKKTSACNSRVQHVSLKVKEE